MIDISHSKAREIILIVSELRNLCTDLPGNRPSNMRRRGKLIIDYLNKKLTPKNQ